MSNPLIFNILPFDPTIIPNPKMTLQVDLDDFAHEIEAKWPIAKVRIDKTEGQGGIDFYISTEREELWVIATFAETYSVFSVSGWPKRMAKEMIFWYRHYVPTSYPLFLVIPESGYIAELTDHTTLEAIEKMYPFPVSDE